MKRHSLECMEIRCLLSCLISVALLSPLGAAEESVPEPEAQQLPTHTVQATRVDRPLASVPAAVSRLDAEAIQRGNWQVSLDEALETVPGVFVLNPYNYAQDTRIAIRGFGARADFGIRGIQLIVDGIPATTPDGQGEVDGLDLGSVERIEVLRGPASALYGSASGGVLRITTERGPPTPFAETRWTVGEDGFLLRQFKAGGQSDGLDYLVSGSRFDYDGYRAHSATEQFRFNGQFGYSFEPGRRLEMMVHHIDLPRQDDPGGLTRAEVAADPSAARQRNVDFDAGETVAQQRIGLRYTHALDAGRRIETTVFYTHRDFANKLPFESGGQVSFQREHFGGSLLYGLSSERTELTLGADIGQQIDDRRNYNNVWGQRGPLALDQEENVRSLGLFALQSFRLTKALELSGALRYDAVRFEVDDRYLADGEDSGALRFEELSPMLGLSWRVHEAATVYANLSTAFETPTTTEFDNPTGGGFNGALESQKSRNFEIGARGRYDWGGRALRYELALFRIETEDLLVAYELPAFPGREFYRNAGEGRRDGIEAALSTELGAGFTAKLSYTWSDFHYKDFRSGGADYSGNRLPGIPGQFAQLQLKYAGGSGFFAEWSTRLVGGFYADDANEEKIEAYSVTDLTLGWTRAFGAWTVEPFAGVRNVFDAAYFGNVRLNAFGGRHFEPAPGRNIFGGIRVRYDFR
jgi:iron complex outermembrane receptor protein